MGDDGCIEGEIDVDKRGGWMVVVDEMEGKGKIYCGICRI